LRGIFLETISFTMAGLIQNYLFWAANVKEPKKINC
jgi:hypothetical protein